MDIKKIEEFIKENPLNKPYNHRINSFSFQAYTEKEAESSIKEFYSRVSSIEKLLVMKYNKPDPTCPRYIIYYLEKQYPDCYIIDDEGEIYLAEDCMSGIIFIDEDLNFFSKEEVLLSWERDKKEIIAKGGEVFWHKHIMQTT